MNIMIKIVCLGSLFLTFLSPHPVIALGDDFVILPGDVLHINVWKEDGMDQDVLVLPDGTITFPLIGTLKARDMSPAKLQAAIRDKLNPFIPDAAVTVSVQAPTGHKVSLVGQLREPGEVVLTARMSVMQAISQVGGLTPYADEDDIVIRENADGEKEKISIPYNAITKGRDLEKDISLLPGDVVVVPASGLF